MNDTTTANPTLKKLVCSHCGSDDVTMDAVARWNVAAQAWTMSDIYDGSDAACGACEGETSLKAIDVNRDDPDALSTFTVFVQQADGRGTVLISAHKAIDAEAAREAALTATADDWRESDPTRLRVLGVLAGAVDVVEWDDPDA